MTREIRPTLVAVAAAGALVLFVAWVNVANLLIAQAKRREREVAVRRSLGATRTRLAWQFLIEGAVLSAIGTAGGLLLSVVAIDLLNAHLSLQLQRPVTVDATVELVAAGLTALTAVAVALVPGLTSGTSDPAALRAGRADVSRSTRRFQRTLLVGEVALTMLPLIAAGLLIRTVVNLMHAPLGFDPAAIVTAKMSLSPSLYADPQRRLTLYRQAVESVAHLPGVLSASAVSELPLDPLQNLLPYARAGEESPHAQMTAIHSVLPGYLTVVGTHLSEGRDVNDADVTANRPVAIVDQRIADELWSGHALGKKLRLGSLTVEVVGVTTPVRSVAVRDDTVPSVFVPYPLRPLDLAIVIKTPASGVDIVPAVRGAIASLGTGRPAYDIRPLSDYVRAATAQSRATMTVLAAFAGASLGLAAIGLFGTFAFLTSTRTQELGLRLALGATPRDVLRLITGEALSLIGVGVALGVFASLGFAGVLRGVVYGVAPIDPLTLVLVVLVIGVTGVLAVGQPAWRASRLDPTTALRTE
jgi:predicted permease